jgi:hypothetical protein
MGNPLNPVTLTPIASTWGAEVVSRVVLTFADTTDADAWYQANPPEAGQRRHIVAPGMEQTYDGSTWQTTRRDYGAPIGWRDPQASWGRLAGASATVPDPASTDVLAVTALQVWTKVDGYGMAAVQAPAVGERAYAIEGLVRFDGGAFPPGQDGTAEWRIYRVSPNPAEIAYGIVAVPALSPSGGGASNIAPVRAYDAPPPGVVTYQLEVRKRIPADATTVLRVRYPVGIAVVDMGPRGQSAGPLSGTL